MYLEGREERQPTLDLLSTESQSLSAQLWGGDKVGAGRQRVRISTPALQSAYLPGFRSALVRPCLPAPISKHTALFYASHFHSRNEPGFQPGDILYRLT